LTEYKLEIYFDHHEDLKLIVDLLKRFALFAPEYSFDRIPEFGKMKVIHYHYRLRRKQGV